MDTTTVRDSNHWWDKNETWWILLLVIIEACLSIVILVANALVIAAYYKIKRFQNNVLTHFFLINLAVSDFIVGIAIAVKVITHFLYDHWTSSYKCVLQFTVVGTPLATSSLLLLLITGERYYSIMNPYHNPESFTKVLKYGVIIAAWLLSILFMVVIPFVWIKKSDQQIIECDLINGVSDLYWKYLILPLTYLLLLAVSAMYMKILMVAKDQMDKIQVLVVQVPQSDKNHMRNVRLVKTGFMLLGLFLICWLPFTIILTVTLAGQFFDETPMLVLRLSTATLATFSSAINPFIYAARIRRFRLEIKKMLCLPIKFSDKCETYEIKRTFKIKKRSMAQYSSEKTMGNNGPCAESNESMMTTSFESNSTAVTESTVTEISTSADTSATAIDPEEISCPEGQAEEPKLYTKYPKPNLSRENYSSLYSKKQLQASRSSPLGVSKKWIARSKVQRASTFLQNNQKDTDLEQQQSSACAEDSDDDQDYIAVTVTRIVQDISDSEEEMEVKSQKRATKNDQVAKIINGHINQGVEYQEPIPSADLDCVDGPRKPGSFSSNIPTTYQKFSHDNPQKSAKFKKKNKFYKASSKHLRQPDKPQISDNSTLEEILCNQEIADRINKGNFLNLQLDTDQLNLEVKTKKEDTVKSRLKNHYSQNKRRFASTKKYRISEERPISRAKSMSSSTYASRSDIV